jgi:hypothetical protein
MLFNGEVYGWDTANAHQKGVEINFDATLELPSRSEHLSDHQPPIVVLSSSYKITWTQNLSLIRAELRLHQGVLTIRPSARQYHFEGTPI